MKRPFNFRYNFRNFFIDRICCFFNLCSLAALVFASVMVHALRLLWCLLFCNNSCTLIALASVFFNSLCSLVALVLASVMVHALRLLWCLLFCNSSCNLIALASVVLLQVMLAGRVGVCKTAMLKSLILRLLSSFMHV